MKGSFMLSFLKKDLFDCVYVHVSAGAHKSDKVVESPRTGELWTISCGFWEPEYYLQEQYVSLTANLPLYTVFTQLQI